MAKNNPLPNPLPLAGEGISTVMVAYHDGPYEIHFCGRTWFRDQAQTVPAGKWAEMQARGDFNEFNFTEEK